MNIPCLIRRLGLACLVSLSARGAEPVVLQPPGPALSATRALEIPGDIASNLVAGADRYLDRQLAASAADRDRRWGTSDEARRQLRAQLAERLGVMDARQANAGFEWIASTAQSSLHATSALVRVEAIRWRAMGEVTGEGLLLTPLHRTASHAAVVVPDADLTPEAWIGLDAGVSAESQVPRLLAESGIQVVVPFLIPRTKGTAKVDWDPQRGRNLTHREYLHRAAFEMGRTLAGYEVTKLLAALDVLKAEVPDRPVGIWGWGEGARLALCAAALDPRFAAAGVSGYFAPREEVWREPLDRNVFGLLEALGDAELAALFLPRPLVIEAARAPEATFPSDGGAPGRLVTPEVEAVRREVARARQKAGAEAGGSLVLVESGGGTGVPGTRAALAAFASGLKAEQPVAAAASSWTDLRRRLDPAARLERQRREIDRHTQALLLASPTVRAKFMAGLDTSSPETFAATQTKYRQFFSERVIGRFDEPLLPFDARTRLVYDAPAWRGYEVVLDVHPDVIAYGLLLVPKNIPDGERRPVVVCQHGLEGRPQDTIGKKGFEYYSAFSARLAERGFVVFAPQNLYLFTDRFRVLQRKANPLGKTLFSLITPQHQQIVNWLKTQPFVDPQRIAFYGLSYGGKTAMRVPALVTDYCLSICSADFNEWVWKNTSTASPYSYIWTGEYEIFEWNLGHTFNYAEMAALIAPRPFMVERGHFDGVAPDETVGYEFGKVRTWYAARLKLPADHCRIEWFVGPHQIHGVGTYEFLHHHLKWPEPKP